MTKVRDMLNAKGHAVYSVTSDTKVIDALSLLVDKNIGALAVIDGGKLAGIFSERDYARKVILQGKSSRETPVSDIMTRRVIVVTPDDSIGACMELMSGNKIRHLPVVSPDNATEVVGFLSISDIVRTIIAEQKNTIEQLQQYIQS
ncbi:MAG: CBS domain-containing protein [Sphingobacteriales bacterium]|nr:CBS domain-containing protein [Sphingobacteriales bacterium]MCC7224748.1 CBS domain-containing protein [Chitinophagales bacterium]